MEREILEYLYINFDVGDDWQKSLKELMTSPSFQGKTKKEIRFFLRKMENEGFLRTFKFKDDEFIIISLQGFLHYEENFSVKNKFFTNLSIKFLKFIQDIDNDSIKLHPGRGEQIGAFPLLELYKYFNIDPSYEKKMLFIQSESQKKFVRDGIGYTKDLGLVFFGEDEPFLTFEGLTFLDERKKFYNSKFITNQDMLIKENKELNVLIENKLWKDSCIKIGSIVEYVLTKWIEDKKIPVNIITTRKSAKKLEDISFNEKIDYYINSGAKKYFFEIGSITEWNIVKNVIKDYRNFIHLQKYEKRIKKSDYLNERDFKSLYFSFKSLRELF